MWSVPADYRRARVSRYRKAIICTTCTGVIIGLLSTNIVSALAAASVAGILSWWWGSTNVERCYYIHTLGGKNG